MVFPVKDDFGVCGARVGGGGADIEKIVTRVR